ncbi:hypothetical protein M405DRAFT_466555 [Rhizopogon salebrosus TDB-379]|nr:hypothetical protein M405DRAFT_466555 [Rhizopogon salebrosus TDB-379]
MIYYQGIIVVLGSGVAITLIWATCQCHMFTDLIGIEWSTYMTLGTIAFVDVIIASSLCYILATSRPGFSSTDSFLTKLMAYIINTDCLTRYLSRLTDDTSEDIRQVYNELSKSHCVARRFTMYLIIFLLSSLYKTPDAGPHTSVFLSRLRCVLFVSL